MNLALHCHNSLLEVFLVNVVLAEVENIVDLALLLK